MSRRAYVGFRATEAELAKIVSLARKTRRTKSAVLRLLLEQAVATDGPDVRLAGKEARQDAN